MRPVVMMRKQQGLTQVQLAKKAHVTPLYMSNFETGRGTPDRDQARRVADALGYPGDPMDLFVEIDVEAAIAAAKEGK